VMMRTLTVAVEGCCHGELDSIYSQLLSRQQRLKKSVDLLIICGDFQAIRNVTDLGCMSCPDKYKQIGGFHRYYSGERRAPVPTLFVGGNHEAGNHMRELYYGGWVAPNIYYMGGSGVVRFGGLRIGGISGIFKDYDYAKGHYERPPFRGHARSSLHHVRSFEVFKMLQIRRPLDIVVSHDWPQFIERYGNTDELLRRKPFFAAEVAAGNLGSPANALLLERLRPAWWLSAHMHVRFTATVQPQDTVFGEGWGGIAPYSSSRVAGGRAPAATAAPGALNADEIVIDSLSDADDSDAPSPGAGAGAAATAEPGCSAASDPRVAGRPTSFLSLDKCLPRREFLEILDIEVAPGADDGEGRTPQLEYDPEWLAILRLCHPHMPLDEAHFSPPPEAAAALQKHGVPLFPDALLDRELAWVRENVASDGPVYVPANFAPVAPTPPPGTPDTASFGLAGRAGGGGRGRGGADRGDRGRGRGRGRGQGRPAADAPWPGPQPDVIYPNTQTEVLCRLVGLEDRLTQQRH
ncbi:lariat debranching enzyme, partial [Coemansia javaensis]